MTRLRRGGTSLRSEAAYSVVELLTAMSILGLVMSSVGVVMVSATKADVRMNREFQAQTQARTALERFRREGHAACRATPVGPASSVTLVFVTAGSCPTSGGTQVTWCAVSTGEGRYGLFRAAGTTCDATGTKVAESLTVATAFDFQTAAQRRAKVAIRLSVDPDPNGTRPYVLTDDIVLRNSTRASS